MRTVPKFEVKNLDSKGEPETFGAAIAALERGELDTIELFYCEDGRVEILRTEDFHRGDEPGTEG